MLTPENSVQVHTRVLKSTKDMIEKAALQAGIDQNILFNTALTIGMKGVLTMGKKKGSKKVKPVKKGC